jgi:hypothetical protein
MAEVYYHNSQGQDLLDPATPGQIKTLSIKWINSDGSTGTQDAYIKNQTAINPGLPYLINGYSILVNPFNIKDSNGNTGIVRGSTCTVFVQLDKTVIDTMTFMYSGASLQKFLYNKTLINPPQPLTMYPTVFPVIVTK